MNALSSKHGSGRLVILRTTMQQAWIVMFSTLLTTRSALGYEGLERRPALQSRTSYCWRSENKTQMCRESSHHRKTVLMRVVNQALMPVRV